jgi:hypothetical protein
MSPDCQATPLIRLGLSNAMGNQQCAGYLIAFAFAIVVTPPNEDRKRGRSIDRMGHFELKDKNLVKQNVQ